VRTCDVMFLSEGRGFALEGDIWIVPREFDVGGKKWLHRAVDSLARELHPLLAMVKRNTVADLPRPEFPDSPRPDLASPLFRSIEVHHEWTAQLDEVLAFEVDALLTQVFALADEFGGQLTRGMLEHIGQICDDSGNTVSAEGRDLFDVMIETLAGMDIEFDEDGNHNLSLVMRPDTVKKFEGKQATPEQEEALRAVMERKREEWSASRRRRKLP